MGRRAVDNPRHERFAQTLAEGKTTDGAYVEAGHKENRGNATRMKSNERIMLRAAEIQERGAIRAEVTVQSILEELEQARLLAMQNKQAAAAVSASMGKAKIAGMIVERQERGKPGEYSEMSDADLAAFIERETAEASCHNTSSNAPSSRFDRGAVVNPARDSCS